jgi:hypothetical protein
VTYKEEILLHIFAQLLVLVAVDIMVMDHLGHGHLLVQYFKAELGQEMDKLLLVGNKYFLISLS